MGKPYSMDLRERVIAVIESGVSTGEAAKRFAIGKATAGAWSRLKRATGSVKPPKQGKPKGSVLDAHAAFIFGLIEKRRDITLEEIAERVASERGVRVVSTAVWKFLDRHDMTHKKRPPTPASRSAPM
jgi:transposase